MIGEAFLRSLAITSIPKRRGRISRNWPQRAGKKVSHSVSALPSMTNMSKGRDSSIRVYAHSSQRGRPKLHRSTMILLDQVDGTIRTILDRALDGHEISSEEALRLCETTGPEFHA